jgi:hypothetical protein
MRNRPGIDVQLRAIVGDAVVRRAAAYNGDAALALPGPPDPTILNWGVYGLRVAGVLDLIRSGCAIDGDAALLTASKMDDVAMFSALRSCNIDVRDPVSFTHAMRQNYAVNCMAALMAEEASGMRAAAGLTDICSCFPFP